MGDSGRFHRPSCLRRSEGRDQPAAAWWSWVSGGAASVAKLAFFRRVFHLAFPPNLDSWPIGHHRNYSIGLKLPGFFSALNRRSDRESRTSGAAAEVRRHAHKMQRLRVACRSPGEETCQCRAAEQSAAHLEPLAAGLNRVDRFLVSSAQVVSVRARRLASAKCDLCGHVSVNSTQFDFAAHSTSIYGLTPVGVNAMSREIELIELTETWAARITLCGNAETLGVDNDTAWGLTDKEAVNAIVDAGQQVVTEWAAHCRQPTLTVSSPRGTAASTTARPTVAGRGSGALPPRAGCGWRRRSDLLRLGVGRKKRDPGKLARRERLRSSVESAMRWRPQKARRNTHAAEEEAKFQAEQPTDSTRTLSPARRPVSHRPRIHCRAGGFGEHL